MPFHHFVVNFINQQASAEERELLQGFPADQGYLNLVTSLAVSAVQGLNTGKVPIFAISGSQGTGKSTLAHALQCLMQKKYGAEAVVLSLDDFYLTRDERLRLANEIHPLLQTRGVPGTHDYLGFYQALQSLQAGRSVDLPVFDKACDDRVSRTRYVSSTDLIICEGWCWGARPEPEVSLRLPINELEKEQDGSGRWRHFVNRHLSLYQGLFSQDFMVYLQAPAMEQVFAWRWQQEKELREATNSSNTMNKAQVIEFIQFYERLTRWMFLDMPQHSNLTVKLDELHRVSQLNTR